MITFGFFSVLRAAGVAIGRGAPGTALTGTWLKVNVFFLPAGAFLTVVSAGFGAATGFAGSAFLATGAGFTGA